MSANPGAPGGQVRRYALWSGIGVLVVALIGGVWWAVGKRDATAPSAADTASTAPVASPSSTKSPSAKPTKASSTIKSTSGSALPELSPVGLDSDAQQPSGMVVSLKKVESVAGEAHLPGEVAGAALRVTILLHNGSDKEASLDGVVVNGYRGSKRTPLESITSPGGMPFRGSLKPGGDATGIYLFTVEAGQRADVTFTVDVSAGQPAAVFRGDAR